MDWITILGIALALAMDAFAVALAAGTVINPITYRHLFRLGFHFGLFQSLMPIAGWLVGMTVQKWISSYDHWIAFLLLAVVGVRMILEAFDKDHDKAPSDPTRGLTMVMLSVATSIDALAVGLSLAMLGVSVWRPAADKWGQRVEICGGLVLCIIGLKILLEHTLLK